MYINGIVSCELSAKMYPPYIYIDIFYSSFMYVGFTAVDMSFGFCPTLYFRTTRSKLEKYLHFSGMIYTVVKRRRFEVTLQILDEIIHDISSRFLAFFSYCFLFFFLKNMHIIYVWTLYIFFITKRNGNDELRPFYFILHFFFLFFIFTHVYVCVSIYFCLVDASRIIN